MRIPALLLSLSLAASATNATEPAAPAAAAAAVPASPAAATSQATPAATAPVVSPETLKKAAKVGLKPRQRKGTTMYCKDVADIGTRFETEHCYAAADLDTVVQQITDAQEMARKAGACGGKACGGN